ncbi:hypothetical protein [Streptomyces cupreus]|uniref:CHAT domain-containing protein n=1 Tax=Streptomyces cupreus TaxID=2759956 RepID=A0A7X1J801_9ACTN|nr:hypothetical protein [Streptomyces cupreus]MBC2905908.1 hypothetical protein [Streptomyces cupreus]
MALEIAVEIVRDPSRGFTGIPPQRTEEPTQPTLPPSGFLPQLRVTIRSESDGLHIEVNAPRPHAPWDREWHSARLEISERQLWELGGRLRTLWQNKLVRYQRPDGEYGGQVGSFPLAEATDLTDYAQVTDAITTQLADQGHALMEKVLKGGGDELRLVRDFLMAALTDRGPMRVSFASCVNLPWSMLAVNPAECAEPWEAFLGCLHQIEQGGDDGWNHAPLGKRDRAATSLNKDTALDGVGRAAEVHRLLDDRSELVVRTRGDELLEALSRHILDEDVMYFWCHGHYVDVGVDASHGGSGHGLSVSLSDGEPIDGPAVSWRRDGIPRTRQARFRPFVLLNACHTGRGAAMGSLKHLGQELRAMGADGVLAPQIEIPQVFATEYAYCFLELYLAGKHTAGEITRELVQQFADKYHNPLALAYALHCGIDSRLNLES